MIVNIGPQHPAVHGVLRLVIELINEECRYIFCEIGHLHRGTEKLIEYSEFFKVTPFFDRFDYTSLLLSELVYSLCLEKIEYCLKINNISLYNNNIIYKYKVFNNFLQKSNLYFRTILGEISRINAYLLTAAAFLMDLGVISTFLWIFEKREEIFTLFEFICGSRMHTNLFSFTINFIQSSKIPFLYFNEYIILEIQKIIYDLHHLLLDLLQFLKLNRIFISRVVNIGVLEKQICLNYGITGPMARSSGLLLDTRLTIPYDIYRIFPICSITSDQGDNFTRFVLRSEEIFISLDWIKFCIHILIILNSKIKIKLNKLNFFELQMETIISNFKKFTENIINWSNLNKQFKLYLSIESAKGEFSILLDFYNSTNPRWNRLKICSPGFNNLSALSTISYNYILSDLFSYLGSLDLILGEVDR